MGMRRHSRVEEKRQRLLDRKDDVLKAQAKARAKRLGQKVVKYT